MSIGEIAGRWRPLSDKRPDGILEIEWTWDMTTSDIKHQTATSSTSVHDPVSSTSERRLIERFCYRPEIDGLRAVAVLAVVIYHAGLGISGGFVGVDVFFVISGFLITSLVIKDLEDGVFSIARFYERRARRIIPASIFVVLCSLVVGGFLMFPEKYDQLGQSALAQSVGLSNIYFWQNKKPYFGGAATDETVLLHTWSLAVEEQFYLFVPLILLAVFKWTSRYRLTAMLSMLAVGIILSGLASIYGVAYHREATFYNLPFRAWELLIGSFLAVLPATRLAPRHWLRECATAVGCLAIVITCVIYTNKTPFPGLAAIPPCTGAALIIWGNTRGTGELIPTWIGRVLGSPPIVFIGLISYSLYLWHWPLFAFSNCMAIEALTLGQKLSLVALSFVLAVLTWHFVESPFRKRTVCASRKAIFAFSAMTLAVCGALGAAIHATDGLPQRMAWAFGDHFPDNPIAEGKEWECNSTVDKIEADEIAFFGDVNSSRPPQLAVWGDSHAMCAMPAFDQLFKEFGLKGCMLTKTGTAPVAARFHAANYPITGNKTPKLDDAVIAYIRKHQIPNVALVARWDYYDDAVGANAETVQTALLGTIDDLKILGCQVIVMCQIPHQPYDVPRVVARVVIRGDDPKQYCAPADDWNGIAGTGTTFLDQLRAANVVVIDPRSGFLDASRERYEYIREGISLYCDADHFSRRGAILMLLPLLEQTLFCRAGELKFGAMPSSEASSLNTAAGQ